MRRLQDQRLLQFAHSEYGTDHKSPLDPELRKMVWGDAAQYMQDSYGYPSDSFPSTRQMKKQLMNTVTKSVLEARYDRKKGFPRVTPLVERCRRTCSRCPLKEVGGREEERRRAEPWAWQVLERRQRACKAPDCRPGKCSKSDDPLTKQVGWGGEEGQGRGRLIPGVRSPGDLSTGRLIRSASKGSLKTTSCRSRWVPRRAGASMCWGGVKLVWQLAARPLHRSGEPITDSFVDVSQRWEWRRGLMTDLQGWDMHNGVDFKKADQRA